MNNKISEVGKKLKVEEKNVYRRSKRRNNLLFWGIHAMTIFLASVFGFIFGEMHQYPYSISTMESLTPVGLTLVNGAITLPPSKFNSQLRGFKRALILCANFILAGIIFFFTYYSREDFSNSCTMGVCVLYGVYSEDERTVDALFSKNMVFGGIYRKLA